MTFIRIYKGLGKVQKKIIGILEGDWRTFDLNLMMSMRDLVTRAYHSDYTKSEYLSILRAVHRLEKRRL